MSSPNDAGPAGATPVHDLGEIDAAAVPDSAAGFLAALPGPSILRLRGRDRGRCRALSVMLHGNEPSGLRALHRALRDGPEPAVDVVVFIGGVEAARIPPGHAHRFPPGRRDLNRCFRAPFDDADGRIAEAALGHLRARRPEALVDLHNNTGHNPCYGVGLAVDSARLGLVSLWSRLYVHSTLRLGALMEVDLDGAPVVTIEAGRAGDPRADDDAYAGLARYLAAEALDPVEPRSGRVDVLGEPIRVLARGGLRLAFAERPDLGADLTLDGDIDRHNFRLLPRGDVIGWVSPAAGWPLVAIGEDGQEVSRDWFALAPPQPGAPGGAVALVTRRDCVPIMMTTSVAAATSDCLFYIVRPRA